MKPPPRRTRSVPSYRQIRRGRTSAQGFGETPSGTDLETRHTGQSESRRTSVQVPLRVSAKPPKGLTAVRNPQRPHGEQHGKSSIVNITRQEVGPLIHRPFIYIHWWHPACRGDHVSVARRLRWGPHSIHDESMRTVYQYHTMNRWRTVRARRPRGRRKAYECEPSVEAEMNVQCVCRVPRVKLLSQVWPMRAFEHGLQR